MIRRSIRTFCLTGIIFGVAAAGIPARAEAPSIDFSPKWLVSPLQTAPAKDGQGKIEVRVMERMVRMDADLEFPVGTLVYFKFPKPRKNGVVLPFNPDDVAEKMRYSLGIPGWRARRQEKAYVYEAEWTNANRYVRLYMIEDQDTIAYTVATFRPAFETLFVETEMIQRQLFNVAEETVPWLRDMTAYLDRAASFVIADALAGPPPACCPAPGSPPCAPTNYACWANQACCTQGTLANQYNGPLNAAQSQLNGVNQNWSDTNREARRANNLLAQFMDPGHAALWAGATAFGAMAGAMVFNLVIDGVVAGAKAIYELITGEEEEKQIMERFKKAREIWTDVSRVANELESAIDNLIDLKEISKKFGKTREQALDEVKPIIEVKRAELENRTLLLNAMAAPGSGYTEACKLQVGTQISNLRENIEDLARLKDYLKSPAQDAAVCEVLTRKLSMLKDAQSSLQKARSGILVADAKGLWQKQLGKEYDKSREEWKIIRDGQLDSWRASAKLAKDQKEKGIKELNGRFSDWLENCMRGKVGFIGDILILGGIRYFWSGACKDEYTKIGGTRKYWEERKSIDKSFDDTMREADATYWSKVKYKDEMHVSNPALDNEHREYLRFFNQLTEEQACLFRADACPAGANGSKVSKFDALTAKAKRIQDVCMKPGI